MYKYADIQITDFALDDMFEGICKRMGTDFKAQLKERSDAPGLIRCLFDVHGELLVLQQDDAKGIQLFPKALEMASPKANLLAELIGSSLKESLW